MLSISEREILACTVGTVGQTRVLDTVSLDEIEFFLTCFKDQLKEHSSTVSTIAIESVRRETLYLRFHTLPYVKYFMEEYCLPYAIKTRMLALQEVDFQQQLLEDDLRKEGLPEQQAKDLLEQTKGQFFDYHQQKVKKLKK